MNNRIQARIQSDLVTGSGSSNHLSDVNSRIQAKIQQPSQSIGSRLWAFACDAIQSIWNADCSQGRLVCSPRFLFLFVCGDVVLYHHCEIFHRRRKANLTHSKFLRNSKFKFKFIIFRSPHSLCHSYPLSWLDPTININPYEEIDDASAS